MRIKQNQYNHVLVGTLETQDRSGMFQALEKIFDDLTHKKMEIMVKQILMNDILIKQ